MDDDENDTPREKQTKQVHAELSDFYGKCRNYYYYIYTYIEVSLYILI